MKCLLFADIRQEMSIVKSDFKQSTGVASGDIFDCHSRCKCGKPYGMAQTSSRHTELHKFLLPIFGKRSTHNCDKNTR